MPDHTAIAINGHHYEHDQRPLAVTLSVSDVPGACVLEASRPEYRAFRAAVLAAPDDGAVRRLGRWFIARHARRSVVTRWRGAYIDRLTTTGDAAVLLVTQQLAAALAALEEDRSHG